MCGDPSKKAPKTQRIFVHHFFVVDFPEKNMLKMKVVPCKIFMAGARAGFFLRKKGLVNINMANMCQTRGMR